MICSLCASPNCQHFYQDRRRDYYRCGHCDLVFVPAEQHLSSRDELAEYQLHENDPDDQGYLRFLNRLAEPMLQRLSADSQGLDFGCGPGPAMSLLFGEAGVAMANYDPLFANQPELLTQQYDCVSCSEVAEHFNQPSQSWPLLLSLLKPGGLLGVMTKRHLGLARFKQWHYKNDLTHVAFYSDQTMEWLAHNFQLDLELVSADVALFRSRPAC
ncbi:class I SAM-dependent methyltransferase [Aliagarivorans marinus]|uniref:class I SAM-dependent methyltransferase n=1 Tax=Aliagarivorans marinus TaxID=561965 RepID=UPI0004077388|nr:class I SAM-dependent methyltransferase [Aliagarivorans marinus]